MKILHVALRLAEIDGGVPQGLLTQAKAQAHLGDEVAIVPCSSSGGESIIEPGNYGRLTVLNAPTVASLKFPNRAVLNTLRDITRKFDIVHIHGSWRYHLVAAAKAARRHGIPFIVSPEGDLGRIPRKSKWYVKGPYFTIIEKRIFNQADALHCYTSKELQELRDMKLSPRHFVVPQPVEESLLNIEPDPKAANHICPDMGDTDPMLLYLGRVVWIKRLPLLLDAFINISREFSKSHLVLAGPWEDTNIIEQIKTSVGNAGLETRVHLPGMVRGGAKVALLERSTVFVLPSSHENFGISAAEALLFGKACVVSEGVALSEDIAQAKAGLVFADDSKSLARALRKILADEALRERCATAARQLANNFKPKVVAQNLKKEYEFCIKTH